MGITLRAARVNKGMTQAQATEKIGVTELTLRKYERGESWPKADTIKKMLELYDVQFEDVLFTGADYS